MKNRFKRILSFLLVAVMLFSLTPNVFGANAQGFSDFPTGWSKPAMEAAVANGLLTGYDNNEIRPTANLTRAEFAAIIARAFGAKTVADISQYSDVSKDDWYYDYIAKVVKMGAMNGISNTAMNPDANITREEVFTAVARVLVLSDSDISGLSKFKDSAKVSSWAANSMSALAKRGYVNGDDLGNANPRANITREEFAQFMYNAIRTYITKSGIYDKDMEGIVVLRTGDVELENLSITSDLVIGDGVLEDSVKVTNVKVEKRLLARGGTVTLKNTTLGENVVVNNVNGITFFKNYRDEKVFTGLIENTEAKFLTRPIGGGGQSYVTVTVDGVRKTYPSGTTIDSVPQDKLGYTFVEWLDGNGSPIAAGTVLTNGMEITASRTLNTYPINYLLSDGTAFLDAWFKNPTDLTKVPREFNIENQNSVTLPTATQIYRMGYKFINWLDGATPVTNPKVKEGMNTTDGLSLKATMETLNYTVSYKHDGEDVSFNTSVTEGFTVENMAGLSLPTAGEVNLPGYTFNGWKHSGNAIDSFDDIDFRALYDLDTTEVVLEADTTPITYDITYMVNGSPMSIGAISSISADFTVVDIKNNTIVLPVLGDVNETGYTFERWLYNGSEFGLGSFASLDISTIDPSVGLVLEAELRLNEYDIAYKYKGNDVTFKNNANVPPMLTIKNASTLGLPTAGDLDMKGYTFNGWSYKKEGVSYAVSSFSDVDIASLNETDGLTLEADLTPIPYNISYRGWVDGQIGVFYDKWIPGITKETTFDVEHPYVLPAANSVVRAGYGFLGWFDKNGNQITEVNIDCITGTETAVTVYARFKLYNYTVEFNAEFTDGSNKKTMTYNAENYKTQDKIDEFNAMSGLVKLEAGEYFGFWHLSGNEDAQVNVLSEDHLFDQDGAVLSLEAKIADQIPLQIRFFKGYTSDESKLIYTKTLFPEEDAGNYYYTYTESDFVTEVDTPAKENTAYRELLFDKANYAPLHYDANSRVYVKPDFRFEKDGKLTSFYNFFDLKDDNDKKYARISGDPNATSVEPIDVYLTYQQFKVKLTMDGNAYSISSPYGISSRILDSTKRLAVSSKEQLEVFKSLKPEIYNKIKNEAIDKMVKTKLVDEDLNLKIFKLDLPVSMFITKTTAEGMVKTYVRDTISDRNKLESVLGFIDIAALVNSMNQDELIGRLSDLQIVSLMKSNKTTVSTFIKEDLESDAPVLLDAVAEFISKDSTFKQNLVSDIVTELKKDVLVPSELRDLIVDELITNGTVQGSVADILVADIKSGNITDEIVNYVKTSDLFLNWVISDLQSQASTLMPTVVSYLSGVIDDDTDQGKDLRLELMKSSVLVDVLENASIKTAVINLLIDDQTVLNSALENEAFRKFLVDEAVKNEAFIDYMLDSDRFKNEIISAVRWLDLDADGVWEDEEGEADKKGFLHDALIDELSDDEFIEMIDKKFQEEDTFKALLEEGGALRQKAIDAITLSDYITSEDDLLRYILNQGNCGDYSQIITQREIETYLEDNYDEYRTAPDADAKQLAKDNIYADSSNHSEIISKVEAEFEDYKVHVLNDFIAGSSIPEDVLNAVNAELIQYIKDYLTGLNDDDSIGELIVNLVRETLKKDESEFTPGTKLAEFKEKVDDEKELYLDDLSNLDASEIIAIVTEFMQDGTNEAIMRTIVTDSYDSLTDKLADVIAGLAESKNAAYETLDDMLITNLSNLDLESFITSTIKDLVNAQDKTDAKELIKKAVNSNAITNAQIKTELQKYANTPGNEATLKTDMISYIAGMDEGEIKNCLKSITSSNETQVRAILLDIVDGMSLDDIKKYAKDYIDNDENDDQIDAYISSFIDDVDEDFVKENRATINSALSGVDITEFADAEFIMEYVDELSDTEKIETADAIYDQVSAQPDFENLIDSMTGKDSFTIKDSNLFMVQLLAEGIKELTFEKVLEYQGDGRVEKLINTFGRSFIEGKFNESKNAYTEGLDEKISIVSNDETKVESYTTKLPVRLNLIREVINPLYEKALPKVVEKMESLPVKYSENEHLQYLVEHDVLGSLLDGSGIETDDLTGYRIKDEMELFDYVIGLFMVSDDAICWYGDEENITEEKFDAVYDAVFEKAEIVKEKIDDLLKDFSEDGEVPSQVQKLLDSISQINNLYLKVKPALTNLVDKYFEANIDDKIDPDNFDENKKLEYAVDMFFGKEDPVFTIDTLYLIFYTFDEEVQAKLKSALDSGKLQAAVDKFEATAIGKKFKGNGADRIINILENIAENGVEQYKVNDPNDLSVQDSYEITVAGNAISVTRSYFFNN